MTGCVDVALVLSWIPIVVILAGAVVLFGACVIVEWDRNKAARERRSAAARRWRAGMERDDR